MYKNLFMSVAVMATCISTSAQTTAPDCKGSNNNPISANIFCADPTALEYDGRLYVYGTNDHQQFIAQGKTGKNDYGYIKSIVVFSTDDMVNWTFHGTIDTQKICSGWQPSDLVIIAGRPAMGKTSFALSLLKNIAIDYREPVAFFSLEMNSVQLVNRLISNVCEIPGSKLLNGQLSTDEWERFDKNMYKMEGAPVYIDDTANLSIFELRTKARRLAREHGIKALMIDYLQLMNASGMRFGSRQEEVSHISRSLNTCAGALAAQPLGGEQRFG